LRRLYPRGPSNVGIAVDAEGAMLGPACVLVRRAGRGYRCIGRDEAAALQDYLLPMAWSQTGCSGNAAGSPRRSMVARPH
jgi:hypothetical protein